MKKKHIQTLTSIFKDFHTNLQEKDKQLSDLFDKILVWIISLSTGAIVFIISSVEIIQYLNKQVLGISLFFLIVSIITGVVGRIFSAISIHISYSQAMSFDIELEAMKLRRGYKLNGTETTEIINEYMLEDFEVDISELIATKNKAEKERWKEIDKIAREYYEKYAKMSEEARNAAFDELKKITISSFGLKKNAFNKKGNNYDRFKGIINSFLLKSSYTLYLASAVSFCFAITYLAYSFFDSLK